MRNAKASGFALHLFNMRADNTGCCTIAEMSLAFRLLIAIVRACMGF